MGHNAWKFRIFRGAFPMTDIIEGQVYEGPVSALGSEGPDMRWIVVSPHGKTHAHSLGDPLDLRCMPLGILQRALVEGRLTFVESVPDHPVIRLQKAKERRGLVDTHMGLHGQRLAQMVELLEEAVASGVDYAPYLAGEILALYQKTRYSEAEANALLQRVRGLVGKD